MIDKRFTIWKKYGYNINGKDSHLYMNIRKKALTILRKAHLNEYNNIIKDLLSKEKRQNED